MGYASSHGSSTDSDSFEADIIEFKSLQLGEDSVCPSPSISSTSSSSEEDSSSEDNVIEQDEVESPEPITSSLSLPPVPTSNSQSGSTIPSSTNHLIGQPGYDPNRIPASVFATKPTTPMDWSVASNESLFSLHMGNGSFSKDHAFMLYKSGELPKLDDTSVLSVPNVQLPPSVVTEPDQEERECKECCDDRSTMPPPVVAIQENDMVRSTPENEVTTSDKKMEVLVKIDEEELSTPKETVHSSPRNSEQSNGSARSFAFPLLSGANHSGHEKASGEMQQSKNNESSARQQEVHTDQDSQPSTIKAVICGWFSCFYYCRNRCFI